MTAADKTQYVNVGHVSDAFGLKGELYIHLKARQADWLKNLKTLRLIPRSGGEPLDFRVSSKRVHKNGLVVRAETLIDRTGAELLIGSEVEIPQEYLVSEPGEKIYLREIAGFHVIDEKLGDLGPVRGFGSNGPQDLLILECQGREVLIPFVEVFIRKLDFENRRVEMTLPDGLVDLE